MNSLTHYQHFIDLGSGLIHLRMNLKDKKPQLNINANLHAQLNQEQIRDLAEELYDELNTAADMMTHY